MNFWGVWTTNRGFGGQQVSLIDVSTGSGANFGVPTLIMTDSAGFVSGDPRVTTVSAPAGSLILVYCAVFNSVDGSVTSVTDSAGNVYTQAIQASGSGVPYPAALFYKTNAAALNSGGTITIVNSPAVIQTGHAFYITGANGGIDKTGQDSNTTVSGTSATIATGALSSPNQIIFGGVTANNSFGTFTEAGGFTTLIDNAVTSGAALAYRVVTTTASITYDPTWTSLRSFGGVLATFKAG